MKSLFFAVVLLAGQAHAVVFDAYKDSLEDDLLCGGYPKISLSMHLQMLAETGALRSKASISNSKKPLTVQINGGFEVFGFPLESVTLIPSNGSLPAAISVALRADPRQVARSIEPKAVKITGQKGQLETEIAKKYISFSWNDADKDPKIAKGFEITVSKGKDMKSATITCGTFTP